MNSVSFNVIDGMGVHHVFNNDNSTLVTTAKLGEFYKVNVTKLNGSNLELVHSCHVNTVNEALELLNIFVDVY